MSETYKIHDPFLGKDVQISDRLVDRLRGKYASGPHLPNGNPEFGWRQFQAPPIQHEAAAEIERLRDSLTKVEAEARRYAEMYPQSSDGRNTFVIFADWVARLALSPSHSETP
jgi:hypothetical protein